MNNKYSDVDFLDAISKSFSIREVLKKLGLAPSGGSYKCFNLRAKKLGANISHFTGKGHLKNKTHNWSKKVSLEELLVNNSNRVLNTKFKDRLIKEGYLVNICVKCGLKDTWQNEPIVLHLDHVNGDHFDHRLENIRLLCPNCHSQTSTYCSKNNGLSFSKDRNSVYAKVIKETKLCAYCNCILKNKNSTYCLDCYCKNRTILCNYNQPTKIIWPTIEELKTKLETMSYVALGKELGISDNAIRKHIKNNELHIKK